MKKSAHHDPVRHLALRVREIAQLFHSMDPTPFLNKDLDPEAERFIDQVRAIAEVVHDAPQPWPVVSRDPKDDYLAALARAADVDAIISGDGDLTSLVKLVPTVFTPAGFLALINEGP